MKINRSSARSACAAIALLLAHPVFADRDGAIGERVRAALMAAGLRDAAAIGVASFNGEVDLSGSVRSEHVRDEAARIAAVVPGVTAVHNTLTIRQSTGEGDADGLIAERVRRALTASGIPDAANIQVNAFNGEVDLAGRVASEDTRTTAARVAGTVRGVVAVRNGLQVREQ